VELGFYLAIVRHRALVVVGTLVAALAAAVGVLSVTPPVYTSAVTLRLGTSTRGELGWESLMYAERLMNTYARLAESGQMRAQLREQLPLDPSPTDIEAEILQGTELITVRVSHSNPQMAQNAANTLAVLMVAESARGDRSIRTYPLIVTDAPSLPLEPSQPRRSLVLALALGAGLVAGIGLAFLAEYLDARLYTTRQIQQTTCFPVLARIPHVRRGKQPLIAEHNLAACEAFRQLRTELLGAGPAVARKLLVMSAAHHEGRSTVAANLALVFAQAGRRVLVVDGDLRRPHQHVIFRVAQHRGLTQLLRGQATLKDVLQRGSVGGVEVLPSGPLNNGSPELLMSATLGELLDQLAQRYDIVLIDTTALAVSDAMELTKRADGVLLVVRRGVARQAPTAEVSERLRAWGLPVLGVVVNDAERGMHTPYYAAASAPSRPSPADEQTTEAL
jgi:polysaccharide biosynthesis transport protein